MGEEKTAEEGKCSFYHDTQEGFLLTCRMESSRHDDHGKRIGMKESEKNSSQKAIELHHLKMIMILNLELL